MSCANVWAGAGVAEPLLELRSVGMAFGGLRAVDNVSFTLPEGRLAALIGPNGAGKTTLFALMSGFLRPHTGSIHFAGQDVTGLPPHRNAEAGMARTFQIVQPFAAQTVHENIAVGAHLRIAGRRAALAEAERVAERVGLAAQLGKPAAALTVAGRKRLELARALATRPRLLLLDEVLAGLNPQEVAEVIPVVYGIASGDREHAPVTVLMIEHVMQAVMNLAEQVWVLAQGQLIAEGTPQQVTHDERVIEAYLGHGTAARLARAAVGVAP
jgi:branched-chain amino acid transport system ATP-binding protein